MPNFQRIDLESTYTCAEAAALVSLREKTVSRAATSGRLAATLTESGYLIRGRDLTAWRASVRSRVIRGPRTQPVAPPIDPDTSYSLSAAMTAKDVTQYTIRAAIETGQLAAIRNGNRWVIRGADLLAWTPRFQSVPAGTLSLAQAAASVGMSANSLRRPIRDGQLRASVIAGMWTIDPDDLASWRRAVEGAPTTEAIDPDALYRMRDAAKLLGVSRQRAYQLVDAGQLTPVDTAHGKRLRGVDLLTWRNGVTPTK